MDMSGYQDFG